MSMRRLPQIFDSAEEMFVFDETGANSKGGNRGRLQALRAEVLGAYEAYAEAATCSDLISIVGDLQGPDAKALKSNYPKLRSGVKKEIGAAILRRSRTCCLCWHAPAGQLDHHLPQVMFPEFSVLTLNLIPVCAVCNHTKSNDYQREDGGPSFLHAYRDPLPLDGQFLVADIHVGATVLAQFRVVPIPTLPDALFATLEYHFRTLGLAEIYGNLASEVLVEKLTPLYEYYDTGGGECVEQYLRSEAVGVGRLRGINHWKPVLLNSLAGNQQFCEGGFAALGQRDETIFDGVHY